MKKITLNNLWSLLLIVAIAFMYTACNESDQLTNKKVESTEINSVKEFKTLADNNVFPLDKLSQATVDNFTDMLVFDEENNMTGGSYTDVRNELNDQEFAAFWELITGDEFVTIEVPGEGKTVEFMNHGVLHIGTEIVGSEESLAEDRLLADRILFDRCHYCCLPLVGSYCRISIGPIN